MKVLGSIALLAGAVATQMDYTGYKVVKTIVDETERHNVETADLDVWDLRRVNATHGAAEIMLPPGMVAPGQVQEITVEDVQALIQASKKPVDPAMSKNKLDPFYDDFRTLAELEAYVDTLVRKYPEIITTFDAGATVEGRRITGFKVSTGGARRKGIFYSQANVHCREWLAMPTLMYIIESLVEGYYAGDPVMAPLVDGIDFHIIPMVNKDGYEFTWNSQRLWRKNRRPNPNGSVGVDLNRNWGPESTHCTAGSSTNPGSDTYCGPFAYSEPETQASKAYIEGLDFVDALGSGMTIDWHTYGALLLSPFQYTYDKPPAYYGVPVTELGSKMEVAINSVYNSRFRSIQGSDLYPHSGGMIDWSFFEGQPNAMSYTFELRGNSFIVPPSDIVESGEENLAGIIVGLQSVLSVVDANQ